MIKRGYLNQRQVVSLGYAQSRLGAGCCTYLLARLSITQPRVDLARVFGEEPILEWVLFYNYNAALN
jgi:hypothetical protein